MFRLFFSRILMFVILFIRDFLLIKNFIMVAKHIRPQIKYKIEIVFSPTKAYSL